MDCSVLLDQYYREHIVVKAVATRRAEYAIEALKSFFAGTPAGDVDIPLCREYRLHRAELADATVRRELGVLQAAVNHAVRWRREIGRMPSIELPPGAKIKPLWLFKEEMTRLSEAAASISERAYKFVVLAYYTAGRKASVETLELYQIDLELRRIDLQKSGAPVTKKRRPIVPISEEMLERLTRWKEAATTQWLLESPADIRYDFDRAAEAAGLTILRRKGLRESGRLSPHILRHSRATHLLQDGKSPFAVANLLGDTVETVLRVYGHACSEYLADVIT